MHSQETCRGNGNVVPDALTAQRQKNSLSQLAGRLQRTTWPDTRTRLYHSRRECTIAHTSSIWCRRRDTTSTTLRVLTLSRGMSSVTKAQRKRLMTSSVHNSFPSTFTFFHPHFRIVFFLTLRNPVSSQSKLPGLALNVCSSCHCF